MKYILLTLILFSFSCKAQQGTPIYSNVNGVRVRLHGADSTAIAKDWHKNDSIAALQVQATLSDTLYRRKLLKQIKPLVGLNDTALNANQQLIFNRYIYYKLGLIDEKGIIKNPNK